MVKIDCKSYKSDEKGQQTPKAILERICLFCTYCRKLLALAHVVFHF